MSNTWQKSQAQSQSKPQAQTLIIRTPEGVVFRYVLASPLLRFLAWSIDMGCLIVLWVTAGFTVAKLGYIQRDWAQAIALLSYFLIPIAYGIALEWKWRGQTIGKRICRLRVMDAQALRLR